MLEYADLSRTIIGLGLVLLLMAAVFWLVRRFGPAEARAGSPRAAASPCSETLPLDPRTPRAAAPTTSEHLVLVSSQGSASLLTTTGGPPSERDADP
ncbi:MAG: hypothetical protein R3D25_04775 [Geminicoccaceae bacterium]